MDKRAKNVEIFRDTQKRYFGIKRLNEALSASLSAQRFYPEGESLILPAAKGAGKTNVVVSGKRSLEAAEPYVKQGKRVCVLNFASAKNPGGGVVNGASAQEECLCRCSTLYPCLSDARMLDCFYIPHREMKSLLYNDDCIYTPDVMVFKSDTEFPEPLPKSDWWSVNILTCAAPNLRNLTIDRMNSGNGRTGGQISAEQLRVLLLKRIRRIFTLAALQGNQVLILGAFGCGAFRNPPDIVAAAFCSVMEEFSGYFETIEYAVYCTERDRTNLEVFQQAGLCHG